eukprot:scaffold78982_cov60-Phaeocystis_antarctica.AAC.1
MHACRQSLEQARPRLTDSVTRLLPYKYLRIRQHWLTYVTNLCFMRCSNRKPRTLQALTLSLTANPNPNHQPTGAAAGRRAHCGLAGGQP